MASLLLHDPNSHFDRLRTTLRVVLKKTGLLGVVRRFRRRIAESYRFFRHPEYRDRALADRQRFRKFKEQYGSVLERIMDTASGKQKKVLIIGKLFRHMETQLALLKGLEFAGFRPIVLSTHKQKLVQECYRWTGVREIYDWSKFVDCLDFSATAETFIERCASVEELLAFDFAGSRCGKIAASTTLRQIRTGILDLQSPQVRLVLTRQLASAMTAATAAQSVLRQIRPQLMLSSDVEYTPGAELFDNCMAHGIEVVTYNAGHKDNTLMLKRYSPHNRDQNPVSLSEESWKLLRTGEWGDARRNELREELYSCYSSGNWYGSAGTQFNTRLMDAAAIRARLGLSPERKTAFIFPHIPWDASLRWGRDLFRNPEEWLIETVRAACLNDSVNWVIKIHPANVGKQLQGNRQEPAEVAVLRRHFGRLPSHICVIPPDSDIGTYSLFDVMDYCVTVRGTVGIEAASFGIPVITAGTGRYERKGFTIDPESRAQYLDRISRIHEIARLSPAERELAERFAHGIFVLRPLPLRAISLEYGSNSGAEIGFTKARINITAREGWHLAPDLKTLAQWISDARNPDFLIERSTD